MKLLFDRILLSIIIGPSLTQLLIGSAAAATLSTDRVNPRVDPAGEPESVAKPTPEQVQWQDMELEMFVCLDPCTWQDREYDNHSTPLKGINPVDLDTEQWVAAAQAFGAKQILFVAKHTGGFCWWQTDTSDYGIKETPWRSGRGDVVAELARSCRQHGLKLALYLSPRDDQFGAGSGGRCKTKEEQERYTKVYRQQWRELLSRYGDISEVWFDGSCVIDVTDILEEHAPKAMVFQGPQATIRWVGNERGHAPYPAWNTVKSVDGKSGVATARHGDPNGNMWMPIEVDTTLKDHHWFWSSTNEKKLKSLDDLIRIYYASVGHGCVLLLNSAPNTRGLIPAADMKLYQAFGAEIRRRFGQSIAETSGEGNQILLDLGQPTWIDHVITMENINFGERVREYVIEGQVGDFWIALGQGTAMGHKKIDRFNGTRVSKVRLKVLRSVGMPKIHRLAVFDTEPEDPKVAAKLSKPTPEQVAWADCEIGMFIHFAPNTWFDSEGDDLRLPPEQLNPAKLDTDQWVAAAEGMGAKFIVFVAKHVGGFCMWQTETTDYSIKSSPWRGGKGDVLDDLTESCRKRGMMLGVYLSPCDRKHGAGVGGRCRTKEAQEIYNKLYRRQLTEVLTKYGTMFEVWFDGSNIVEVGDILEKYASEAMVFQGPHATIRWVGNEGGVAPYPAWNSLSAEDAASGVATSRHGNPEGAAWLPNECDARIRANWFWSSKNAATLKSVEALMEMYYRSVGHGAVLLLNHTPDKTGLIPEEDLKRGAEFGAEVKRRFGKSIAETSGRGRLVELDLGELTWIDHVITMEDIRHGERVREYMVEGLIDQQWQPLCKGTAIGHKKIDRFSPVRVQKIRFHAVSAATTPLIRSLAAYSVFDEIEPTEPPSQKPVALWRFDQVRDGKITDASGRGRVGEVTRAQVESGRSGQALRFNGRDAYVSLGNQGFFRGDFSIAGWIKTKAGASGYRVIIGKETSGVGANQCRFYLADGNRLGFMMSDAYGTHLWPFESQATVPADEWSHVAVARKGMQFILYLNGQEIGTKTSGVVIHHSNLVDVKIGCVFSGATTQPTGAFNGLIDELSIYNRALVATEVDALAKMKDPVTLTAPGVAWNWSPKTLSRDWTQITIDLTPHCTQAAQYQISFNQTDGQNGLEIKSATLLFDGRETPEWIERIEGTDQFIATLPGVGVPIHVRVLIRGAGGIDSSGQVIVRKKME